MKYAVWTGNDLFAMVFEEDESGNVVGIASESDPNPFTDTPLFTYCIVESAGIEGSANIARRPSTGRKKKKLVSSEEFEYTASVTHMYLKIDELDKNNVFIRDKYIAIYFVFLSYMKQPSTNKEWHAVLRCKANSFSIESRENGIATCSAEFMAEEYNSG